MVNGFIELLSASEHIDLSSLLPIEIIKDSLESVDQKSQGVYIHAAG